MSNNPKYQKADMIDSANYDFFKSLNSGHRGMCQYKGCYVYYGSLGETEFSKGWDLVKVYKDGVLIFSADKINDELMIDICHFNLAALDQVEVKQSTPLEVISAYRDMNLTALFTKKNGQDRVMQFRFTPTDFAKQQMIDYGVLPVHDTEKNALRQIAINGLKRISLGDKTLWETA